MWFWVLNPLVKPVFFEDVVSWQACLVSSPKNRARIMTGIAENLDLLRSCTYRPGILHRTAVPSPGGVPDVPLQSRTLEHVSHTVQTTTAQSAFDSATEATLQRFLYPSFLWRLKKALRLGAEKSLKRSLEIVDRYMTEAITARKETPSDDLLSRFMKKKDVNGNAFPSSVLQWIALNFVLAGRDTSSVALSWFFWTVMQRPDIEKKVVGEITSVLKGTRGSDTERWVEEPLAFEELERLVYLKAALAETLRLYPSVPEDSKYVVAEMTYFLMAPRCQQDRRSPTPSTLWEGWNRYGARTASSSSRRGPRTCLGKDLAYLQMKSIASAILLRQLEAVPGHRVEQKMSLTLFMKNGLRVYVQPRDLHAVDYCCSYSPKKSNRTVPLPATVTATAA
ncbi:uncharacterized protein A4U43_C07F80 [Asparagus officinalis]|uniref:noroxomaritidine synthase n=1 Tax=Asparagus officinalis TaxID=4686 RepID=A0A5P1E8L4_ASPOF|nr:uncharacterized protein A4U43_C07F80 [Asparagus officinalis]